MTIAPIVTETQYALAGANLGPFSTVWPFEQDSDVKVAVDLGSGLQTLANGATFTISDAGTGTEVGGGSVTLSNTLLVGGAWPANSVLYLWRSVAGGQPSAFGEMGQFSPQACEQALDHVTREVQETKSLGLRVLAGRPGETLNFMPSASERAFGTLGFDQNGQPTVLGTNGSLSPPTGQTLATKNATYSADTSAAAVAYTLAPLAQFNDGDFIEVDDPMNNAAANNITIQASGADQIYDHGAVANVHTINNSNTITRYRKRNGQWRVMQYGG